ncbi:MAG: histidine kinase dimerization/phospho-acceptor domain-containing protein, partial [Succinivibrio sp.]
MKAARTLAFRLTAVSFILSAVDLAVILLIMNAQMASLGQGHGGGGIFGVHSSLLWIGMILVAVSACANFAVFKGVSRPLGRLADAAGQIAAGRFGATVPEGSGFSDIAALSRAFNTMSSTLGRNEDNRRKLFAGIAHELRTPLAVIEGNLEAMVDDVMEPSKERLLMMQDEIMRAIRLVGDLRDLSLAEAGRLRLERRSTDIAAMLSQAAELMEPLASEQGMRFSLNLGSSPCLRSVCTLAISLLKYRQQDRYFR